MLEKDCEIHNPSFWYPASSTSQRLYYKYIRTSPQIRPAPHTIQMRCIMMDVDGKARDYCLQYDNTTEESPWKHLLYVLLRNISY